MSADLAMKRMARRVALFLFGVLWIAALIFWGSKRKPGAAEPEGQVSKVSRGGTLPSALWALRWIAELCVCATGARIFAFSRPLGENVDMQQSVHTCDCLTRKALEAVPEAMSDRRDPGSDLR
ncbi:hypothetical protein NDU88_010627 [Pleurodeles waltl]|uniref:Uncharacterized protein n=1 Tax=Pleurodeles waltl TaxID=8319 RepID=A0AAV7S2G3_PLEWA|nr:hypothetical protein NDU88_010627 [Pleurodeles waltl]